MGNLGHQDIMEHSNSIHLNTMSTQGENYVFKMLKVNWNNYTTTRFRMSEC